jgi:hypothetical protein
MFGGLELYAAASNALELCNSGYSYIKIVLLLLFNFEHI